MSAPETQLLTLKDARWAALAATQPEATIFHHPAWAELLQASYGYQPELLVVLDAAGQIAAALPLMQINSWLTGKRIVALPFSDFCPPLILSGEGAGVLVEAVQAWRAVTRAPAVQVRWPLPSQAGVYPTETYAWHLTRLDPDSEQVFQRFAKTQVQQRIRKAERDGVSIRMGDCWEDVQLFYGLHLDTRRRLGAPIQPLHFFKDLWEHVICQGRGFVLLAYKDAQLLAGAVFLHNHYTLTYKYSASDPDCWKLRPNNLILWHAIRWGCEHGFQIFDWGRTDLENAGLRDFKLGWGSEEHLINYSILADCPPRAHIDRKAHAILPSIIQHTPTWVCRLTGEIFYRHFG